MKNKNVKSVLLLATLITLVFGTSLLSGCKKHGDEETDCFSQGYLAGLLLLNPNNPNVVF
jgi:hypothetical protein